MRYFFDTEFYEDGTTIDLISIGIAAEDGRTFYAVAADGWDEANANEWVRENVLPHLGDQPRLTRADIAKAILEFAGDSPEWWGYYADYDWVVLCQLYGRMVDLPKGWPMYCRDLNQLVGKTRLPKQTSTEHHALADAVWIRDMHAMVLAGGAE